MNTDSLAVCSSNKFGVADKSVALNHVLHLREFSEANDSRGGMESELVKSSSLPTIPAGATAQVGAAVGTVVAA